MKSADDKPVTARAPETEMNLHSTRPIFLPPFSALFRAVPATSTALVTLTVLVAATLMAGCRGSDEISSSGPDSGGSDTQATSPSTGNASADPPLDINPEQPLVPGSDLDQKITQMVLQGAGNPESSEEGSVDLTGDPPQSDRPRPATPRDLQPDSEGTYDLTFDDLAFDMEIGDEFKLRMLTNNIRQLHKNTIRIKGFIKPDSKTTGIEGFVFVRDDKECCFGPTAALFDCIIVSLEKGTSTEFTVRPITVEGYFYVKEYKIGNQTLAIYRMRNAKVK